MLDVLKIIAEELAGIEIPYEFERWTADVEYPYFVGEYTESPAMNEDGLQESEFILTGTTRGSWLELEQAKAAIEQAFNPIEGKTLITPNGNGVAIFYGNAFPVPTGVDELKRIQINLQVKNWKVI